jgi:uncharacterized protein (TIGR00251 family)
MVRTMVREPAGGASVSALRLSARSGEVLLGVRVIPGAAATEVRGVYGDRLKIAVAAPAERGRANEALLAILRRMLGGGAADLRIESGHGTRDKVVAFSGITETELRGRLTELLSGGGTTASQEGRADGP